ncbi:MAG: ABC transporter permease [Thermoproteota archaeon]
MYKAWQFMKRGFISMLSYRTAFVLSMVSMVIGIAQFAYMAIFLKEGNTFPGIARYGGDLMAFLISGNLFISFMAVALSSFQGAIRSEQLMGTLEFLLLSDTPLSLVLLYSILWDFLWTLVNAGLIFAIAVLIFSVPLQVNLGPALLVLGLAIICLAGVGLASAGIIMVTKVGDPITWASSTLSGFLSGVIFPVEILPDWLQKISAILPPTYALSALRKSLLVGASLADIQQELLILALMAFVTIPTGLLVFRWGFNRARRDGTLVGY